MECRKTCGLCREKFIARSGNAKYCPDCRTNKKKVLPKSSRRPPKYSLTQVLKMLDRYNSEHRTSYTYGQFAELLDGGKLKGGETE